MHCLWSGPSGYFPSSTSHFFVLCHFKVVLNFFTESNSCMLNICFTSKRSSESHSGRRALQRTQLRPGSSVRGELYRERQHCWWFLVLKGFEISTLYFLPILLPRRTMTQSAVCTEFYRCVRPVNVNPVMKMAAGLRLGKKRTQVAYLQRKTTDYIEQ